MHREHEQDRKIAAIEAELARQARMSGIVLGIVATLAVLALAVLLAHLTGILKLPDRR